ncbi:MAG: aldehyde dehydrogenase (NADP(+)), partial [Leadbetterella sp.]|nr:aldehyde dehydrogenase (NADP(+)) [Leadbetterella sp.]
RRRTRFDQFPELSSLAKLPAGTILDVRIDTALPERTPPRPDIRKTYVGLGPVVVFGASNFPFAFSTAGGDTASAIAAGCPVIVKAHSAHTRTAGIMAEAISRGVKKAGYHPGTFAQVFSNSREVSQSLVKHPLVKAVGFTGSYTGGKALFDIAGQRPEPIPVFAEMGSVNPVFVLPEKIKNAPEEVAQQYIASLTLGVGQFCTNPGIIIVPEGQTKFLDALVAAASRVEPCKMLHEGIADFYVQNKATVSAQENVQVLLEASSSEKGIGAPSLALVSAEDFLGNDTLQEEVFGPFGLVVTYRDAKQLNDIARKIHGQLTCTLLGEEEEIGNYEDLLLLITEKCGRLLFNGYPTGVEVVSAMQHSGPFPACTDSRFTSVGPDAIRRFARPVSFQNVPDIYLPDELKNSNPLDLYRLVNGEITKGMVNG